MMTVKEFEQVLTDNKRVVVYCGYNTSPGTLEGDRCFRSAADRFLEHKYTCLMCDVSGADRGIGDYLLGTSWYLPTTILFAGGVEIGRTKDHCNGDAAKYAAWIDDQFAKAPALP
jgi:hypothetical protein